MIVAIDQHRNFGRAARALFRLATGRASVAAWPTAGETVRLTPPRARIGVDGEAVAMTAPLELACRPGALRVLGPPVAERRLRLDLHM